MPVGIRLDTREAEVYIHYLRPRARRILREIASVVATEAKYLMIHYAPERTGELKRSIVLEELPDGFAVYPTVYYAAWQDQGVCPSPGRYIPAIGKRYTREFSAMHPRRAGMHPGYKGYHYIEKTARDMRRLLRSVLARVKFT